MNKWILLLLVGGLAAAGWLNRERISEFLRPKTIEETELPAVTPPSTPNPAIESTALAKRTYPALAMQGSAFNTRFVALFNELKVSNPDFLAQPNWPLELAERTAKELGGGVVPLGTPVPNHMVGGLSTPKGGTPKPTATPALMLPGLQGSSLDKPASKSPSH